MNLNVTRALKRLICQAMVGVLLFAQLAIASHACAQTSATAMQEMATPSNASQLAECDQMSAQLDQASPNVCAEHCHTGQQSADHVASAAVSPALLTALYILPPAPQPAGPSGNRAASLSALAASPPHTILHCCLRV